VCGDGEGRGCGCSCCGGCCGGELGVVVDYDGTEAAEVNLGIVLVCIASSREQAGNTTEAIEHPRVLLDETFL
jgi:hypothetical protein